MTYDETWDRPHQPGEELGWQESDCYWFYDANTGVGGYQRIGQKPNAGTGQVTLFVFDKNGERYTVNDAFERDRPIGAEDRWEDGHQVESHRADALGDGRMRFRWDEPGSSADIEFYESFHTPRGWSKSSHEAKFMEAMNPGGHLEVSGRIKGQIRIGDRDYTIDALAHRDRSWGFRDFAHFDYRRFRMFSGTVGPELSFATFVCDTANGRTVSGFVVRDGVDEDIADLRVLVTIDADGLTSMGGTAVITLQSGEKLTLPYRPVQAYLTRFPANNGFLVDTISEVDYAGKTGFCDSVHNNNPARGTHMPDQSDTDIVAVDLGLSPSASYAI
jgi:hypothetical protein